MVKFKRFAAMVLALCLCAVLLPTPAHASANALPASEYQGLEDFLHQLYCGWSDRTFDYRNIPTGEWNLLRAMLDNAPPYMGPVPGGKWDAETNWYTNDPLGKWQSHHKRSAAQVDWVLANVFQYPQADIDKLRNSLSASPNGEYLLDGYYYSVAAGIGGDLLEATITDAVSYENYYYVTYRIQVMEEYGGDLEGRFFAVVRQKTIEDTGTPYWSLYYHKKLADGEKAPVPDAPAAAAPSSADKFIDVRQSDYFYNAARWGVEEGIVTGSTANTFSPGDTCTKAQILTFLWRANGSPEPTGNSPFNDVSASDYYYKAAVWAWEKRLVPGGSFRGSEPCTRAMTVTYLWKLAGSPAANGNSFSDVPSAADYAQAVLWAVGKGITGGTGGTSFSPDAVCTRAQIITFLYRNAGFDPVTPPDLKPTASENDGAWKDAYIEYVNGLFPVIDSFTGLPKNVFKLMDVNGDGIPELFTTADVTDSGELITYYNGSVKSVGTSSHGLSYIPGSNLLMNTGGRMDNYYNTIYTITDGEFIELHNGEYGAEDNSNVQYDTNGKPIYKYFWNGTQVSSKEEYDRLLNAVFDEQKAVSPYDGAVYSSDLGRYTGNGLCSLNEIIDAITRY